MLRLWRGKRFTLYYSERLWNNHINGSPRIWILRWRSQRRKPQRNHCQRLTNNASKHSRPRKENMHVLGVKRYSKFDHEFTKHSILSKSNLLCQLCDKRFFHKKDLERHMKSTHFNRFYTCNDCSKNFVHEYLYKKHRNSSCGNVKDTYFECISDGCSRKFKEKRFMNEHYKRDHKGRMEMYCMNCQKGFRHRSTYYRHKNINV